MTLSDQSGLALLKSIRRVAVRYVDAVSATGLVIFDCDGVLVDSDRLSLRVQADALTRIGLPTTYEDCVRDYLGIGMNATIKLVEQRLGVPLPKGWLDELSVAVETAFKERLTPVPGVMQALNQIRHQTCVASSGSQQKMRLTLSLTGLYERFAGRIYSCDEVTESKPAPDVFLHAASSMGVPPDRCVVVEDSPAGIAGASAAGMHTLGYAAQTPRDRLASAEYRFDQMADLPRLIDAVLAA